MSIQDLYLLYDKGYSIHLDGDKKTFIMENADRKIKGIVGIKKESRSS
ncbi:hypothetical protein [Clostridium cylindrosporum]|uniref:Uncharacterized protein n=1 Tax=Clostridium cylindrosporum DSM 605 TaxID=1121307 RepID=A0A0J8DFM4_CLOCY|nr:hypothetical protein [Clostridium cylindrosporum]KMT22978.1 hypothetical protein CLCY_7c00250 [Clostridium cylindrosporum DSM 605]